MTRIFCSLLLTFCFFVMGRAQTLSATVVDQETQQPVPYASVIYGPEKGSITNEEGQFSIHLDQEPMATDSLRISCMGYEALALPLAGFEQPKIALVPKAIELDRIILSNKTFTAAEVVEKAVAAMATNYPKTTEKRRLFFRESHRQTMSKMDIHFKESTIPEFNKAFMDSVVSTLPRQNDYYVETLCDLYTDPTADAPKIQVIKAAEMYDKNAELGIQGLQTKFNAVIQKRVKPDSYFKIKSGWFGTKMDVDEFMEDDDEEEPTDEAALQKKLEEERKAQEEREKNFAQYRANQLQAVLQNQIMEEDPYLNVLQHPNRYDFSMANFTYMGEDPVYLVDFAPKRGEDYKGRLYINADDFAVLRVDFTNVKSIKKFALLGVSMNHYFREGKMFFAKEDQKGYHLKYYEVDNKRVMGVDRPLKIVEKNKHVRGRRKQNELTMDLDIQMGGWNTYQLIVFDTEPLAQSAFTALETKNEVLPQYLPQYDPSFWQGYDILEPNQAIKAFKAAETED